MNEELHRHLDGELPDGELGEESRKEVEAWGRLLDAFRTEVPGGSAPPWLETRVMAEIEALPEPGSLRRALSWILSPRPVSLSPLTTGVVTAALAAILVLGRQGSESAPLTTVDPSGPILASLGDEAEGVVYIQFVLDAPGAASVAVTGDFDGWEGSHGLEDLNGDGVWSGRVPVRPGVHAYMFLVDGSTWMTDPRAERFADDGFGNRNAILAVATPAI
jgi:hypothetical protein